MVKGRKLTKKYDITQCALYKCRSQNRLYKILLTGRTELNLLLSSDKFYSSFSRDKADGDKRVITASKGRLKTIQKRILWLLVSVQRPEWLISGERGKSYITNGQMHANSDYLLTMDIRKFYDHCQREYIWRFFVDTMQMSSDVAAVMADIVTLEGGVPTGCPTSQMLAYYGYQEMFFKIHNIARQHNCIFTLYVDDMTFSSANPFDHKTLTQQVEMQLRRFGHRLKREKVRYYPKGIDKPVTGTVVSKEHTLRVPNKLRHKIYRETMELKGLMAAGPVPRAGLKKVQSLQGKVHAARNVEPSLFPEVKRLAELAIDSI